MSVFDNMKQTIEENQKRWQKIENMLNNLNDEPLSVDQRTLYNSQLLRLLVEHLRPLNPSSEQIDDTVKDLTEVLSNLGKK